MRKHVTLNIFLFLLVVVMSASVFMSQTTRNQTTANDFKVKYRVTMGSSGGPATNGETITMIKGARERSENHTG